VTLATAGGDVLGSGVTDADGRAKGLAGALAAGVYRLTFDTGAYFAARRVTTFYPEVDVVFEVAGGDGEHYHVPLLVSPFGYSTYRGS
jgi:5-hydroxyisourate hydrolase